MQLRELLEKNPDFLRASLEESNDVAVKNSDFFRWWLRKE